MYPGASLWLLLTLTLLVTSRAANSDRREATWGDWLLVDDAEPGTSILLRRITPKSVFVAPSFNGCSEGYQQDSLGRCVKLVKVNQQAQWNFFLERLNSMYAPSSTSKKPQKEAGPFHISLPIGSDNSQEETGIVRKRVPPVPVIRDESVRNRLKVQYTTNLPATTITSTQEPTTLDVVTPSTLVDYQEITTTEREIVPQTEYTSEEKRVATVASSFDPLVMLGDQPVGTEDSTGAESLETPKINHHNSQLPEKPFVIIVTNEPTTRTEETSFPVSFLPVITTEQPEEETSEVPTTTEANTAGTTETTMRYSTDVTPRITTELNSSFSEMKELEEYSRPTVKYTTVRPRCSPATVFRDISDCEPVTEFISEKGVVTTPVPTQAPLVESSSKVRFPLDSVVPVQKTQSQTQSQSYVRFPEVTSPHDDRPTHTFWWPSWQVRRRPGVRVWPGAGAAASGELAAEPQQYPAYAYSWTDSSGWRRRFFQRD